MTASLALLKGFETCARNGYISRLGVSFARFIHSFGPAEPCVLLVCALVAEVESRGHTCLALQDLSGSPCEKLRFENAHWEELCKHVGSLPSTVAQWKARLEQCKQVMLPGQPDHGQPLVLHGERLYLRKYWLDELRLARAVAGRVAVTRDVEVAKVRSVLDRLFGAPNTDGIVDWQKIACAVAVRGAFTIITGGPGTGKTYTVANLLALLVELSDTPASLRVTMAAPSGKAAARLQESILKSVGSVADKIVKTAELKAFMDRLPAPQTLHSLIGLNPVARKPRHTAARPLDVDVLIVDEASMAHLEMMAMILDALPEKAMLVVLGDKDQLASVEAGAVLGDLCHGSEQCHYTAQMADYVQAACGETIPAQFIGRGSALAQCVVTLRRSRRFKGSIGALALAVNAADADATMMLLRAGTTTSLFSCSETTNTFDRFFHPLEDPAPRDDVERLQWNRAVYWNERAGQEDLLQLALEGRAGVTHSYSQYFTLLQQRPADVSGHEDWVRKVLAAFERFRILAAVREGIWGVIGINEAVERHAAREGKLKPSSQWYHGRPVIITRTDRSLAVHNGDVGICLDDPQRPGAMRVYLAKGEGIRSISALRLSHVETAFAMTVHKVQGSEFEHVALVLPAKHNPVVSRELIYTGITRAKEIFTLLTPDADVLEKAIHKATDRTSGLRDMLNEVILVEQSST
jgi:exodeoxyribonuclease V alpha subunit